MEQTVSSSFTPWWKFFFPIPFITFCAFDGYAFIVRPNRMEGGGSWDNAFGEFVLWAVTIFIVWQHTRYRRVKITETGLLVSNYFREIHVPFTSIASVAYDWRRGHRTPATITVVFREMTPLGREAEFFPRGRRDITVAEGIAAEIRARAGLASPASDAPAG